MQQIEIDKRQADLKISHELQVPKAKIQIKNCVLALSLVRLSLVCETL